MFESTRKHENSVYRGESVLTDRKDELMMEPMRDDTEEDSKDESR